MRRPVEHRSSTLDADGRLEAERGHIAAARIRECRPMPRRISIAEVVVRRVPPEISMNLFSSSAETPPAVA